MVVQRLVFVIFAVFGCKSSIDTTEAPAIFASSCAVCHGPRGTPPASLVASTGVRDLQSPELRARVTAELVERQVRNGSANKMMPAFEGTLTDAQIKSVAAWVASPAFVQK